MGTFSTDMLHGAGFTFLGLVATGNRPSFTRTMTTPLRGTGNKDLFAGGGGIGAARSWAQSPAGLHEQSAHAATTRA